MKALAAQIFREFKIILLLSNKKMYSDEYYSQHVLIIQSAARI